MNLKTFLALPENRKKNIEYQTLALRRNLLNQINRHRQSITGPVLKTRLEMKENILTKERLQNFMEHHSKARDIPIQKVQKKASDFLDEIAANYNMIIIKIASAVITWVLKTMFEGVTVDKDGLNRVKSMSQKGPVILIPCHKSHIDYLILSYLLYHNNMPCPHVAAGKNLSFWPLGPLFRSGGAFFMTTRCSGIPHSRASSSIKSYPSYTSSAFKNRSPSPRTVSRTASKPTQEQALISANPCTGRRCSIDSPICT
jgi:glycerol-3-phosphate O-acyltransferase